MDKKWKKASKWQSYLLREFTFRITASTTDWSSGANGEARSRAVDTGGFDQTAIRQSTQATPIVQHMYRGAATCRPRTNAPTIRADSTFARNISTTSGIPLLKILLRFAGDERNFRSNQRDARSSLNRRYLLLNACNELLKCRSELYGIFHVI